MTNKEDPRHDPEEALRLIKRLPLWTDVVAASDADDEAKELVKRINESRASGRDEEQRRWAAGRFFLFEVAVLVAAQQGNEWRRMGKAL